ncbi:hypothetical protein ACUR5C_11155 [Aliikangiella sp. IMCC44653]
MKHLLAQSKNYRLYGVYEEAQLEGTDIDDYLVVGDFYGHVECACIDQGEKWCAIGGNGLIIYKLEHPLEPYRYDHKTKQWDEL